MRYILLSYPFRSMNPVYGHPSMELPLAQVKSHAKNDSCSVWQITLENHWGTHIDCPAHFFQGGQAVADFPPGTWFFSSPFVAYVKGEELIRPEHVGNIPDACDLLLIVTGFCKYRNTPAYSLENPGIAPETALWLRRRHPSVRAVGVDLVSVSSYLLRDVGRAAHRAFLDPGGEGAPILLIEDMDLSSDLSELESLVAVPLLVEGIDSAPCTVIGCFR